MLGGAWGIAPQLAALAAALGFGAAQERIGRSRRLAADAATGLILVGALALGVVLASDVFESGAQVDTLLFGSLIGLTDRRLAHRGRRVRRGRARRGPASALAGAASSPRGARALGLRPVLADRLLLTGIGAAGDRRARRGRRAAGGRRPRRPGRDRAAADRPARRAAGGRGRAGGLVEGLAAVWLADALNVGAGPALAVLGGAVFALVAAATAARARAVTA